MPFYRTQVLRLESENRRDQLEAENLTETIILEAGNSVWGNSHRSLDSSEEKNQKWAAIQRYRVASPPETGRD